MPGTHRARRPGRRRGLLTAAIAVLVVVGLGVLAAVQLRGDESGARRTGSPPASSPASPSSSSTASPSSPGSAEATGLPTVAPAPPQRMQVGDVPGVGFGESVPAARATAGPSGDLFARLESRGLPGSPGQDTVVVLGGAGAGGPFDAATLRPGTEVVVETDRGRLTYRIDTTRTVDARALLGDASLQGQVPGRLVLVAVPRDAGGAPTGRDRVAIAHLTGARAF
ncbi:MAG TPA: hypothetical protein VFR99_09940 [Marmoricola sp.]|nr:hypothetical protein [Marmoricola sp.]